MKRGLILFFVIISFVFAESCVHLERFGKYANVGMSQTDILLLGALKTNPKFACEKYRTIIEDGFAKLYLKEAKKLYHWKNEGLNYDETYDTKEALLRAKFRGTAKAYAERFCPLKIVVENYATKKAQFSKDVSYYNILIGAYNFLEYYKGASYSKKVFGLVLVANDWDDPMEYNVLTGEAKCRLRKCYLNKHINPNGMFMSAITIRELQFFDNFNRNMVGQPFGQKTLEGKNLKNSEEVIDYAIFLILEQLQKINKNRLNRYVVLEKYKFLSLLASGDYDAVDNHLKKYYPLYRVYKD